MTLFQSSSLYERVLPKAGPEHTISTEEREKEKRSNTQAEHNSSTSHSLGKKKKNTHTARYSYTVFRPRKTNKKATSVVKIFRRVERKKKPKTTYTQKEDSEVQL